MMIAELVTSVTVGVVLVAMGRWGSRNALALVPPSLPSPYRERRGRVLVRGARTCQILGVVFVVTGVWLAVL